MSRKLDFIIIGAQKSGTTSLHEYLRGHPRLFLPPEKELPFFTVEPYEAARWEAYSKRSFAAASPEAKLGKATPQYMVGGPLSTPDGGQPPLTTAPETLIPQRIRELSPAVRLIAILRDPVSRCVSHHRMARLAGWDQRAFDVAVSALLTPAGLRDARLRPRETAGYVTWGEYGRILRGFYDVFPQEQIFVCFLPDLETSPQDVIDAICQFLGVARYVPENLGKRYRVGATEKRHRWLRPYRLRTVASRSPLARSVWHTMPTSLRDHVVSGYERGSYRIELWNRASRETDDTQPHPDMLARLRRHYAPDTRVLVDLIGRVPPWAADLGVTRC